QIEDELDKLKARLTGSGILGDASFHIECKRENLPAVLKLLGEMLREPTFPEDEFSVAKRGRQAIQERGKTDPGALGGRALQRTLSPYDKDDVRYIPTTEESIERLQAVTLDQVKKLYTDQLGGEHGELVIVGDFDPEPTVKAYEEMLKGWKAKTPYSRIERPAITTVKADR